MASLLTLSNQASADDDAVIPASGPPAKVAVRTDASDVTIGYVTRRAAAIASNGASAIGVEWKDVCVAPCEFQLPAGLHELVATGPGYVGATEKVQLRPGDNHFVVKPGSSIMRWGGWTLAALGLSALAAGITFAAMGTSSVDATTGNVTHSTPSWAVPLAIAGGLAAGGGLSMVVLSSTSIQRESGGGMGRGTFVGAGYTGRF
ncbi:MAG TPA: hypothetical protein VGL81_30945 [Polyangiaceae bacterium]|jgi:hypothetical protein